MRWVLLALIFAGGAALAARGAEPGFSRHSLPLVKEFGDLVAFDLTGNKRFDLITVQVDREYRDAPPVLAVYLHTENGFREAEVARSRLPASLTAIAVGNFPNGPGAASRRTVASSDRPARATSTWYSMKYQPRGSTSFVATVDAN